MIKVNKPKIRFKNFNDSWSLRKLSDTQTDFKDGNYGEAYPKETDLTSSTQGVPFLRGSDLDNGKLTLTNARYITQSKHNELISGHLIEDDIVIAVRGSLGSLGYVGPDNEGWNINSQLAIIRTRKIELIGNYLIQFLLSNRGNKEISSHITGTALKQLPIKQLKNIKVPIPKIEEQSAIGSLFRTLDDLLASYKSNLASYQSLKATMLSKMFPKVGQKVPEIRLDGFEDEWEIKKFKSISNKRGKSNSKGYDYPAYSVSNQSGLIPQSEQFEGSRLENLEKTSYKIVEPNEFAYNPARINVGSIAFNDLHETVIVSSLYVIFSLDKSMDNNYALLFIESAEFNKEVRRNTEGSVREYLFYENFANIRIPIPPSLEEQRAIGSYFSNLDNLINSHQEKISQLETLKKKLLQDMFI